MNTKNSKYCTIFLKTPESSVRISSFRTVSESFYILNIIYCFFPASTIIGIIIFNRLSYHVVVPMAFDPSAIYVNSKMKPDFKIFLVLVFLWAKKR